MKPLKYQREFERIHQKFRSAKTRLDNLKKEYRDLLQKKGNIRNQLSQADLTASKIEQLEKKFDEVLDKIESVKKDQEEANKHFEEVKKNRQQIKQKYGKEFYSFCEDRVNSIRKKLNEIKNINDEIEEVGQRAFKLGQMYVPALDPGFFNKIKKPKKILDKGKHLYDV